MDAGRVGEGLNDARAIRLGDRLRDDVLKRACRPVAEEQLAEGRERADLATRPAAGDEHPYAGPGAEELVDEPGLALPRRTGHEGEHRARRRPPLGQPEELELRLAPHERQSAAASRAVDLIEGPDLEPAEALELGGPERGERRDVRRRIVGDRTDE